MAPVLSEVTLYVKKFNAWCHLTIMLYAVIMRFDSLREITSATMMECRKLGHLGIKDLPRRSTLADANARRSEKVFGKIYSSLYYHYKDKLSSDSRSRNTPRWFRHIKIIDSTTVTLFSNLIFKGVGRNPKTGKKKGGIKVHTTIHAHKIISRFFLQHSSHYGRGCIRIREVQKSGS